MKNHYLNIIFLAAISLVISGCSGNVRETLGIKKAAPDEFMVLSHPPLSIPPEFNLEPPESGATSVRQSDTVQKAKETLFGETNSSGSTSSSTGEQTLLKKIGKSDPNIRDLLRKENQRDTLTETGEKKGFIDKLTDLTNKKKDPLVDADAERERLNQNKAEGKPVTEGKVPTLKQETESVLDQLLE